MTHASLQQLETLQETLPPLQISIRKSISKRIFDILFSISILILLSPLFLLISFLIRLRSPGPIFHRCKRMGQGGKVIECLKFRTMYEGAELRLQQLLASNPILNAEWITYQKLKQDPRITPFGKFLRTSSLDELPQFWNVLIGDLSVVGPRPPTLVGPPEHFLEELKTVYGKSTLTILSVQPGITGIWQISGRSKISLEERSLMEANYALNRTFWNDLVIILKTIPAVLFSRGAF